MKKSNPELKVEYRKIPSLKFLYEITSDGKIRNVKSKKHLSVRVNKKGYCEVSVRNFNVRPLHRLVAEVWVKNTNPNIEIKDLFVNHKNFNKQDNRTENLEWVTQKENIQWDWKNGHRDHLRPILAERCAKIFTGRKVTEENTQRCKNMGLAEQQRRRDFDICYGGHPCKLILPNKQVLHFKSIGRAVRYISEQEQTKFSTIYRNLYKRHYSHGYTLELN